MKEQYASSGNCFPSSDDQCHENFPQLSSEGIQCYAEWVSGFKKTDSRT